MGTLNNNESGKDKSAPHHDGQKDYQHSNQRNRDNIRDNTRDHEYEEYDKTLTNDENYDINSKVIKGNPDFDDTNQNVEKKNKKH